MADDKDFIISMALARIAVLTQMVRILLRERATTYNQSGDDILKWSEDVKKFFEKKMPDVQSESVMTAAIDEFFGLLASEVKQDRENS